MTRREYYLSIEGSERNVYCALHQENKVGVKDYLKMSDEYCNHDLKDELMTYDQAINKAREIEKRGYGIVCNVRLIETPMENSIALTTNVNMCNTKSRPENLDIQYLKQYLADASMVEQKLFIAKVQKNEIRKKLSELGKPSYVRPYYRRDDLGGDFLFGAFFMGVIGLVCKVSLFFALCGICVVGALICFFIGSRKEANFYKKENIKKEQDEQRVKREQEEVPKYCKMVDSINDSIDSCEKLLDEIYSQNIIFPKYRNFIAITQICEYFAAERCTHLAGPNGAYNLFEDEIRHNIIITQLNEALDKLETIKNTQYMIYEAISSCNQLLSSINSKQALINYNCSVIAENATICARYKYS